MDAIGYGSTFDIYYRLGWPGVLALRAYTKHPPPEGYTGHEGVDPSYPDMCTWAEERPGGNLALRLPDSVIGIDIDAYGRKTGAATLAEAEKRWGPLPPTYRSSSRDDGVSGIKLYRVPPGTVLRDNIAFPELGIGDIDIIQRHHRYVMSWPSLHPERRVYQWIAELDGSVLELPPGPADLPELPQRWLAELSATPNGADPGDDDGKVYDVDAALTGGEPSAKVSGRLAKAVADLLAGRDRHDNTRDHVLALLRFGKDGEPGVKAALLALRTVFIGAVTGDGSRTAAEASAEFKRMVRGKRGARLLGGESWVDDDEDEESTMPDDGQPKSDSSKTYSRSGTSDDEFAATAPVPLTGIVSVPSFPVDSLPAPVAAMVSALAEATQTDAAMAAVSGLSALAACAGGHAEIEIRAGWREPLCLYTATVAEPGERKSAVQQAMIRPILDVERQMTETMMPARMEAEARRQIAVKAMEREFRNAAQANTDAAIADAIGAAAAANIEVPPIPRVVADDVTPEAAASLLAEQKGRLAIISAEGGIFDLIAGRYNGNVPNLDLWLKGHSGDMIRIDRKGRPPEYIPRPALTLGLMIQPEVLRTIAAQRVFRGRGLIARFLYALPPSRVGYREIGAAPLPNDVAAAYDTHIQKLATGLAAWLSDPAVLVLTPEAHEAIRVIEAEIEPALRDNGALASLKDWGSKFVGAVARIAGILHLAEHGSERGPTTAISAETVWKAADIGTYFKFSAIAAFHVMATDPGIADAIYLLGRIRTLGDDVISEREMHRACQSRFPKKDALVAAIDRLVDHGYLLPLTVGQQRGRGRPASPIYRIHPSEKQ